MSASPRIRSGRVRCLFESNEPAVGFGLNRFSHPHCPRLPIHPSTMTDGLPPQLPPPPPMPSSDVLSSSLVAGATVTNLSSVLAGEASGEVDHDQCIPTGSQACHTALDSATRCRPASPSHAPSKPEVEPRTKEPACFKLPDAPPPEKAEPTPLKEIKNAGQQEPLPPHARIHVDFRRSAGAGLRIREVLVPTSLLDRVQLMPLQRFGGGNSAAVIGGVIKETKMEVAVKIAPIDTEEKVELVKNEIAMLKRANEHGGGSEQGQRWIVALQDYELDTKFKHACTLFHVLLKSSRCADHLPGCSS